MTSTSARVELISTIILYVRYGGGGIFWTKYRIVLRSVSDVGLILSRYTSERKHFVNSCALVNMILNNSRCLLHIEPRRRQSLTRCGRDRTDVISQTIFWMYFLEGECMNFDINLEFVTKGPINNIPALVQIMAWRWPGDRPLCEPMMIRIPTLICVTLPRPNELITDVICLTSVYFEILTNDYITWNYILTSNVVSKSETANRLALCHISILIYYGKLKSLLEENNVSPTPHIHILLKRDGNLV